MLSRMLDDCVEPIILTSLVDESVTYLNPAAVPSGSDGRKIRYWKDWVAAWSPMLADGRLQLSNPSRVTVVRCGPQRLVVSSIIKTDADRAGEMLTTLHLGEAEDQARRRHLRLCVDVTMALDMLAAQACLTAAAEALTEGLRRCQRVVESLPLSHE